MRIALTAVRRRLHRRHRAAEAGIAGLSFLRGIPGAVGGALRMNGGAYGGETKDVLVEAKGITRTGEAVTLDVTPASPPERFAAWFEPEHFILEAAAPFFVDRFRSLDWTILTPIGSVHWDREVLTFGPPARRDDDPRPAAP